MKTFFAMIVSLLLASPARAQTKTPVSKGTAADQLACVRILKMTSTEWIAHFNEKPSQEKDSSTQGTPRAIAVYGRCYDARTDRLAASLARTGKGPRPAVLKDYRAFDQALKDFVTIALTAKQAQVGSQESAYAALYEKQFRFDFYHSYEQKPSVAPPPPVQTTSLNDSTPAAATQSPDASADFAKAKNHFGELLGLLPVDTRRDVHAAFGRLLSGNPVAQDFKLELYRYAIFLLEPPSAKPFAPPPF